MWPLNDEPCRYGEGLAVPRPVRPTVPREVLDELIRAPYELGGRDPATGIDCLGVALYLARARRLPSSPDPWPVVRGAYERRELPPAEGFPPGWRQVDRTGEVLDDDVVLLPRAGVGYVLGGFVYSASADRGVYRSPPERLRIVQVWRFEP